MPSPPDNLVTPAQLSRFGVPSSFLAQFVPRPIEINISTGGALGVMAFQWRRKGDADWSAAIPSTAGATWLYTVEDHYADLTFATFTYVLSTIYTVDENGVVTGGSGLTAARFDLRTNACSAVSGEAITLMRNAVTAPLLTWGDDVRMHASAMVYAALKRSRGATASGAGIGDENVFLAEDAARLFFRGIGEGGKPDSITDSSVTTDGPMFSAYPSSDTTRGW